MPSILAAEVDPAVLTLVGTLAGIVVTALFGLLTAYLAQRWQFRRTEQEHGLQVDREVRQARRETYARYIASAQQVFDRAVDSYATNRDAPKGKTEFSLQPPASLADAVVRNETARVEVLLLAGTQVRDTLGDYDRWLKDFWPETGSGTSSMLDAGDAHYRRLIEAMHAEVSGQRNAPAM
jgi:hypothetical protein